jgi:eukaryotic-like serine/threonine-protein kinase
MDITAPLALRGDVLLIPVSQLDEHTRRSIECEEGDFAISRPHSRSTSTVIDSAAAALLEQFRKPRTIVEAVVLFSKARGVDGSAVLEDAYHLVRRLMEQDFIRAPGAAETPDAQAVTPKRMRGDRVGEAEILRLLHLVEDTELYLARDADCGPCVLKMERSANPGVEALFRREATVLQHLAGEVGPRLLRTGIHENRPYLVLEHCRGLESEMAAFENRTADGVSLRGQLSLLQRIARAYAALHSRGVLHGDVHPRNVLVDERYVRLIDFGMARLLPHEPTLPRGGVAFFFEPEAARAALSDAPLPPPTLSGEQYSVAALLYYLLTGTHYRDFSLGRLDLMRQIVEEHPMTLVERGLPAWPSLERCLFRALAKEPGERYESLSDFADALDAVELPPSTSANSSAAPTAWPSGRSALDRRAEEILGQTALDQPWYKDGLPAGPTASLNYGAAGIALIVNRLARTRQDPSLLARADAWTRRAASLARNDPQAFVNSGGEISPATVGAASPLHTVSGVELVRAVVAHAAGDAVGHARAIAAFLSAARGNTAGLDLTLGQASTILGAAHLLPIASTEAGDLAPAVKEFGNNRLSQLWLALDSKPPITESDIDNLGIAHGWAGFVYATLLWCDLSKTPVPDGALPRLRQLAALAEPNGRGLTWPWALTKGSDAGFMSGWCNGTAGYVHLWTLAHRVLEEPSFMDLATGAGWDVWDAPDVAGTLCCGLSGRAYALLSLHRRTGDDVWLTRARVLGERAAAHGEFEADYPHSLYKGALVLPALAGDLDDPEHAAHPFFEVEPS